MKIPSKVKILGQDFDIKFLPRKKMKDLGRADINDNIIYLREGMPEDKLGEIFFHEVCHAITEMLNQNVTEDQVNNTAVGLYGFLKENGYLNGQVDKS